MQSYYYKRKGAITKRPSVSTSRNDSSERQKRKSISSDTEDDTASTHVTAKKLRHNFTASTSKRRSHDHPVSSDTDDEMATIDVTSKRQTVDAISSDDADTDDEIAAFQKGYEHNIRVPLYYFRSVSSSTCSKLTLELKLHGLHNVADHWGFIRALGSWHQV